MSGPRGSEGPSRPGGVENGNEGQPPKLEGLPSLSAPDADERAELSRQAAADADGREDAARDNLRLIYSNGERVDRPPDNVELPDSIESPDVWRPGHPQRAAMAAHERARQIAERPMTAAERYGMVDGNKVRQLELDFSIFAGSERRVRAAKSYELRNDHDARNEEYAALRLEKAGMLAARLAHNKVLERETEYKHHTQRPDQEQATLEVMAKAGVHQLRRAEQAAAKGKMDKAEQYRLKARDVMDEAGTLAGSGRDASHLVKKRWQVWK